MELGKIEVAETGFQMDFMSGNQLNQRPSVLSEKKRKKHLQPRRKTRNEQNMLHCDPPKLLN